MNGKRPPGPGKKKAGDRCKEAGNETNEQIWSGGVIDLWGTENEG